MTDLAYRSEGRARSSGERTGAEYLRLANWPVFGAPMLAIFVSAANPRCHARCSG